MTEYLAKAKQGNAEAQYQLGSRFYFGRGGVTTNREAAFEWWRKAAEQGHGSAQYLLGVGIANGQVLAQDEKAAVMWYCKAAEQGHKAAQFEAGWALFHGRLVAKDEKAGLGFIRKAAERRDEKSQFLLSVCLHNGFATEKDEQAAKAYCKKAAEWQSNCAKSALSAPSQGAYFLARCLEQGIDGFRKDLSLAVEWYRRAAEAGDAQAQCALGRCLKQGADVEEANSWLVKAAANGYLHRACLLGEVTDVQLMLQAKANVNLLNADSLTPLMVAVRSGKTRIVRTLLKGNADVCLSSAGHSALTLNVDSAISEAKPAIAELLWKYKAAIGHTELKRWDSKGTLALQVQQRDRLVWLLYCRSHFCCRSHSSWSGCFRHLPSLLFFRCFRCVDVRAVRLRLMRCALGSSRARHV